MRQRIAGAGAIIYLTKQVANSTSVHGYEPDELAITPQMIEAGVDAYILEAAHDEMAFASRAEVVQAILEAALKRR